MMTPSDPAERMNETVETAVSEALDAGADPETVELILQHWSQEVRRCADEWDDR